MHKYMPERARDLFQRVQRDLTHAPGVISVSGAKFPILAGDNWENTVNAEGYHAADDEDLQAQWNPVLPRLLLHRRLAVGRTVAISAIATSGPGCAPLSSMKRLVKRFFKDGNAIGTPPQASAPPPASRLWAW